MAPRRSNRLRKSPDRTLSDVSENAPAQADKGRKRGPPAGQKAAKDAGTTKRAKRNATEAGGGATVTMADGTAMHVSDSLLSLSPEILEMIADNITDQPTISALMRTNKELYALMAPRLYNRILVAAMFHAHIAKVIRTLEPHLTIKQKKQLKKEGKYKGQQERYPTGLDEKMVPICATYVRQLIIGASNPGKKHKYIVDRYYDEVLKNITNVEIVDTMVVNKSVCEGIASLASLKALSIYAHDTKSSDTAPLTRIKNLKHLHLEVAYETVITAQQMIRNSMSTLQSLDMITTSGHTHCFQDWEKNLGSSGAKGKGPDLPALRSLRIEGVTIDEEFVKGFSRAVELSKLHELTFGRLNDSQNRFWPFLTRLISSYKRSETPLSLRTLSVGMHDSQLDYEPEKQEAQAAAKCTFISSFDTLTTLKLPDYGQYRSDQGTQNPGLSDPLLQAILKHKNLRELRISYTGIVSGFEIPYLGARPVGAIVDGLPELREFEFAPDEPLIDDISRALCRGKNLESVTCFPHESWDSYPRPDPLGMNILSSVLSTFMSNAEVDVDGENFGWEDHYKLNRLDLSHTKWDIASKFGKGRKGHEKAEKLQVDVGDDTREVWHRVVHQPRYGNIGYDPTFEWVTKIEKKME